MDDELKVFDCPLEGTRLIEASAGTGKTWNICGLVLRLLVERGLPVREVLVVTFTKAATAELRERVRDRIAEVLRHLQPRAGEAGGDPFAGLFLDAMRARGIAEARIADTLERALRQFDEAAIFTIHGFCKRALDDTPLASRMPLRQEMVEDDSELRQEAANDFWRREIAGAALSPALAGWLRHCKDTPERFASLLRRHAGKPASRIEWPEGSAGPAAVPDMDGFRALHARAQALWHAHREEILGCVKASLPSLNKGSYKDSTIAQAALEWDAVLRAGDPAATLMAGGKLKLLARAYYQPGRTKPACVEHAFFDAAQDLLDAWTALGAALEQARWQLLRRFVETVPQELRERKRQRRLLAYDDMLANLRERLHGEGGDALAQALRQRFPAALIDEFQDTDPLQFEIFHRVYGSGGTLFLVGDPKQAIYSFRNADLHTYLQAARQAQQRYTLSQNQRSSGALIAALNALFQANPRAFMLDGLHYVAVSEGGKKRKPFSDMGADRAALQLWRLDDPEAAPPTKAQARERATQACAAEVARLLRDAAAGRVLHGDGPLRAADIAVLVRSHREGSAMRQALAALEVGSVELAQSSIFESSDAEEMERLLLAVLEPARSGRLRAALATELLGLDAGALEALAGDEAALDGHAQALRRWRAEWLARGVGPMLRRMAVEAGVHARMLARSDGERRLTNFRHLAECLHEAARDHPGPEALLRWFQRQRQENRAEAFQVRLESDRNLVQIVTIHKSKGLEYPVVFCPGLWDGHPGGGGDGLPGCEYHADDGTHVIDYRATARDTEKPRMRAEREAERLRLIYVALTRAVHRLYLVVGGYTNASGSDSECSANPLNWLVMGADRTPAQWRDERRAATEVGPAWARFAQALAPAAAMAPLPQGPGRPLAPSPLAPEALSALPPPARIPWGWQLGSYSSLAHGGSQDAAADHDARAALAPEAAATARTAPADVPADDILRFVRGARAGETLHAVLERIDFRDRTHWPHAIATALRARPPGGPPGTPVAAMLAGMARDVVATPLPAPGLPGGFRLDALHRRVTEMEFNLHAPGLSMERLAALMQRHGYPVPELSQPVLRGYLRGFIDLVAEQGGRWWIVDWKSNHLGWRAADYGPAQLARAMDAAGYHLQYLVYTLALHRWLRGRLAGYDYDTHLGGVFYLFVRGVRPGWVDAQGQPAGVYAHRPSREFIEALDAEMAWLQEAA
ncbi:MULTISPECIES: exodeoxyribonuclease V subunit beta [Ramlibacter]|uniref:RecBCD enzyme subunit RecB n=1 Tax=Ramlibacter aquaticus TaxID=2780094 RepID=A0ABR9SIK5_9BURK|nr:MULTISPECIES: exodeoxyribonuclease V subunit beta [Ramlibacter]MBE7942203.1 exodeoxyribonuclease V subunit beta [Ramlibacter aquaticus]